MNSRIVGILSGIFSIALLPSLSAQTLYSENFDADHTANWTVNSGPGNNAANFFFDYSTAGIPSAPNAGGTTVGLKLEANYSGGVFGGVSVSPTGLNLTGSYKVNFDIWWNFVGPAPAGGSGSTQITGAGIGTAGNTAQWAGGTQDSVYFGATGDGGSASDFRAYSTTAPTSYPAGDSVYAAPGGAINNSTAYYAALGGNTPPAAQTTLYSQQTGTTAAGAPAFAWHAGEIVNDGTTITFSLDNLLIATVDSSTVTLGGGDILFNQYDINATSSTDPNVRNLEFGLIDDVVVTQVPEPTMASLAVVGIAGFLLARRRLV
jgi:hypothetical protein